MISRHCHDVMPKKRSNKRFNISTQRVDKSAVFSKSQRKSTHYHAKISRVKLRQDELENLKEKIASTAVQHVTSSYGGDVFHVYHAALSEEWNAIKMSECHG